MNRGDAMGARRGPLAKVSGTTRLHLAGGMYFSVCITRAFVWRTGRRR